jgi:hypothetical protein
LILVIYDAVSIKTNVDECGAVDEMKIGGEKQKYSD